MWNTRTFTACRNGGAFANGKPIQISRVKELEKSLLVSLAMCDLDLSVNAIDHGVWVRT